MASPPDPQLDVRGQIAESVTSPSTPNSDETTTPPYPETTNAPRQGKDLNAIPDPTIEELLKLIKKLNKKVSQNDKLPNIHEYANI
jgi:hypothetical protein